MAGCTPQATTSALSTSRRGALALTPARSAARTAKPSTLERSNGGASTGAITSAASTRPSAAASATVSPPSGERSIEASKRRRASSAEDHFEELLLPRGALDRVKDSGIRAFERFSKAAVFSLMAKALPQPAYLPQNLHCRLERRSSHRCAPMIQMTDNQSPEGSRCHTHTLRALASVSPIADVTLRLSGIVTGMSSTLVPASLATA